MSFFIHPQGCRLKSLFHKAAVREGSVLFIGNGGKVYELVLYELAVCPEFIEHFPGFISQPLECRREVTRKVYLEEHNVIQFLNDFLCSRGQGITLLRSQIKPGENKTRDNIDQDDSKDYQKQLDDIDCYKEQLNDVVLFDVLFLFVHFLHELTIFCFPVIV